MGGALMLAVVSSLGGGCLDDAATIEDAPQADEQVVQAAATASFPITTFDKSCVVENVAPSIVFTRDSRGGITSRTLKATYSLRCEDGTSFPMSFSQLFSSCTSRARPPVCPWWYPLVNSSSVTYDMTRKGFVYQSGSDRGGNPIYSLVPDGWLAGITAKIPTVLWKSTNDGAASLSAYAKYDSNRMTVAPYRIQSAFDFDGTSDVDTGIEPRMMGKIFFTPNPAYSARVYCFPGRGNGDYLDKPIIVGDAFDPGDGRKVRQIYDDPKYRALLATDQPDRPRYQGYDVIFVNFAQGGGDILINAHLLLKATQWINEMRPDSRVVIGGPSMSGIVSRLALLYSMPENNVHNRDLADLVKGYLSIDSPQQGASIGPSVQRAIHEVINDTSLKFLIGLANVLAATPLDVDPASSADARNNWASLNVPAAHQMLYGHYYENGTTSTTVRQNFYGFLASLGNYRRDIPKVAIAYSNFYRPHPGINPAVSVVAGRVNPPSASRDIRAGGPSSDMNFWELAPGSTGDWYYSPYQHQIDPSKAAPSHVYPSTMYGEKFKGTFIPINSALDLSNFDIFNPPVLDMPSIARYSPFEKVYYMADEFNRYPEFVGKRASESIEDRRYQHIIFDDQVMAAITGGLGFIEQSHDISSALGQRQAYGRFEGPAWITGRSLGILGWALESPPIGHGAASGFEVTRPATSVSFYWMVSSEAGYDWVEFWVDGALKDRISGERAWTQRAYTLPAGTHTFQWRYTKDGSVVAGADRAWLDQVRID